MYNIVPYKLKVVNVEDGILNTPPPITQNRTSYPRWGGGYGDDSNMVPIYEENISDTIIAGNKYLSCNNILESIDSVLSSLHIGGSTYNIYSRKTETATNFTIQKNTESIESNKLLEVTSDEV